MKNIKYSMAYIVIMSFVLSLSLAYSAEPLRSIRPQQGVAPSQQQTPQITPGIKKLGVNIVITSPAEDEPVQTGATYNIKWTKLGQMSSTVNIELIQGNLKFGIVGSTPNDGVYEWPVSNSLTPGQYQIRITTSDKTVQSVSSVFKLDKPSLKITSPRTTDVWTFPDVYCMFGTVVTAYTPKYYTIIWDSFGNTGSSVSINLYMASYPSEKKSYLAVPNNGTYTIPLLPFGSCGTLPGYTGFLRKLDPNNEYIIAIETSGGPTKYKDEVKIKIIF